MITITCASGEIGSLQLATSPPPIHIVGNAVGDNKMYGETYGVEVLTDYRPFRWWHLQLSYTYLQMQLHLEKDSTDVWFEKQSEGSSPHNQVSLRSMMDLPGSIECDLWFRYVENLPEQDVPSYLVLDARIGWRPTDYLELSIVGRNLFDNQHPEFTDPDFIKTVPTEVEHSIYGKVTWRF